MDAETTLAERVRMRRTHLRMTQEQVARLIRDQGVLGVTRRDISRIETGELLTPHFVDELAVALEASTTWLASGITRDEHEQIREGTLAAAGVATVGILGETDWWPKQEIDRERASVRRLLLILVGIVIGASLAMAWGVQL